METLWGKLFLVWTPESFHDYLNLYPNLENALCFVSSVDGNSGDNGGVTVTDPAGVFIQTNDGLSWSSPVTADQISSFDARVRSGVLLQNHHSVVGFVVCNSNYHAGLEVALLRTSTSCVNYIKAVQYDLPHCAPMQSDLLVWL